MQDSLFSVSRFQVVSERILKMLITIVMLVVGVPSDGTRNLTGSLFSAHAVQFDFPFLPAYRTDWQIGTIGTDFQYSQQP